MLALLILITIIADIRFKLLTKKYISLILLLILPHVVLIYNIASTYLDKATAPAIIFFAFLTLYFFICMISYVTPSKVELSPRLKIMMGGRRIFLSSMTGCILQIPICIGIIISHHTYQIKTSIAVIDVIVTYTFLFVLLLNGAVRIFISSRRLGIIRRILILLFFWIPGINIVLGIWFCRIVKQEYLHEYISAELNNARASSGICKTKYPLLMLHGIGFRDYKYLNYWGRIPALLIRNGAAIYYGHQQAWGTIESNASEIKHKLLDILKNTGCEKVNIIAHSKGGLDARYLISSLGISNHVATLTTIATPHRGSELVDVLSRMKEKRYRKICNTINKYFKKTGDTNPDAYASSKQLMPAYCEEFNKKNPDAPGVYYQSYASQMKTATSHSLLMIPYAIMKWVSGDNDGLVTTESAKWGEFKGVFKSSTNRGISHGDLIDLTHQDNEGFNIAEEYVSIVSELKNKGY